MQARRVFVALWPDAVLQAQFAERALQLHGACGGRCLTDSALHLTLCFIGELPLSSMSKLESALATVREQGFSLQLDQYGCWDNGIGWLGMQDVPKALWQLAQALREALHDGGIAYDARHFCPHLSLLRGASLADKLPEPAPLTWSVTQFVLLESKLTAQGPIYTLRREFSLS